MHLRHPKRSIRKTPSFRSLFLAMGVFVAVPTFAAASTDPVDARVERLQKLLVDMQGQLDSLKQESSQVAAKRQEGPLAGELLSHRQRILARATQTPAHTLAVGYTLNPALPALALHVLKWVRPWGIRLDGGLHHSDNKRGGGLEVTGLYEIHRFSEADFVEANLYGFSGGGYS